MSLRVNARSVRFKEIVKCTVQQVSFQKSLGMVLCRNRLNTGAAFLYINKQHHGKVLLEHLQFNSPT